mmetsp:Transcript_12954/g.15821  ORF Transcript_12954/g.15821 Transcript_12954/m.15821 type:complete len:433 (-) Transcript_12954:1020-2318(-)
MKTFFCRHKHSQLLALLAICVTLSQAWSFPNRHHLVDTSPLHSVPTSNENHIGHHGKKLNPKSLSIHRGPSKMAIQMNAISAHGGNNSGNNVISPMEKIRNIVNKNSFLLGMASAVLFARTFPSLGVNGGILKPELFIGQFGVTCIFLLSGVSLELSELKDAITNVKLNTLVQSGSFLAWPFMVGVPLVQMIKKFAPNLLPQTLLDGLIILTCLPTTVNMCVLLTGRAGGNVASALANAVFGNLLGIFVTPALLMYFFGTMIELPFLQMVMKLCNKVLVPVAVGQVLRATPAKDFFVNHKKGFKSLQEMILIGLVWNAFCNAFTKGIGISVSHGFILLFLLSSLHIGSMLVLYKLFTTKALNLTKQDAIAATYATSHKTLAAGLPLVNTIFEGNPNLAAYCAPIMFIHPLQLLIGSIFAEKFASDINNDGDD